MRMSPTRIILSLGRSPAVGRLLTAICYVGFAVLHAWTVIVACRVYGLTAAVISAALLGFAEVYWAFAFWSTYGIWNYYTLSVAGIIAVFGLIGLLDQVAREAEPIEEAKL